MAAAMRERLKRLVETVDNMDKWNEYMEASPTKLIVVDIHKQWCGPCTVIKPLLERIFLNTDEPDQRVAFIAINETLTNQIEMLEDFVTETKNSCKPCFVFIRHGTICGKIFGVDAPQIESLVNDNLPEIEDE